MEKRPFAGLNVIDFTWGGVGPFHCNYLAYYGATVVRVESATRPDVTRQPGLLSVHQAEEGELDDSPVFALTHPVKKYGIRLNIKKPKALDIFKKLVSWADVFVESFTAGMVEKLGLGYEDLIKIKPDIIMYPTNGMGHTGPMAKQPGLGQTWTSLTCFHGISGWPDRGCVPISSYYTDHLAPPFGGLALIAAIDYRRRTGKGQCIDQSQVETGLNYIAPIILDYTVNNRELTLTGNKCAQAAPHGAYRCKGEDRWIAIGVFTDEEWHDFCKVIGNPAWTARRFMHLYGLTRKQLGSVALTFREYANQRPKAVMYAKKLTMDDYLNARMIVEPLCLYDFCMVNDGAVALIITAAERAKNYKRPPVYIMGFGTDHSMSELGRSPEALFHWDGFVTQQAGENAFKMADITLKDVDVAQLYDAFTPFVLSQLESYGVCGRGEAGPFVEEGNLKLNGEFPSNTSGTELSWSYLQGFSHLTEGVRQLRNEAGKCQVKDAEICMVTGLGPPTPGSLATCCILRR